MTPLAETPLSTPPLHVGVVVFPGSNCDRDMADAAQEILGAKVSWLWHQETSIPEDMRVVLIPGGFSYGDHLRCGAISKYSPIMQPLKAFAENPNHYVLGVCNGFQVLTESGLLPGALIANQRPQFLCDRATRLQVKNARTAFTQGFKQDEVIAIPIAHGEGCYVADEATLETLKANQQIVFQYVDEVNGSIDGIAGITNRAGNVLGMMPHPERNLFERTSHGWSGEGRMVFESLKTALAQQACVPCA
ncbi:MAG: phosphoribosylformylglycinamidine synthase subunit PurQ [Vampirovibrionales bacterium]